MPSIAAWAIYLATLSLLPLSAHADVDPCAADVHEVTVNYAIGSFFESPDGDTCSIAALIANPGANGYISLDEAVEAANNTPGADTIYITSNQIHKAGAGIPALRDMTGGTTIIGNSAFRISTRLLLSGEHVGIDITSPSNKIIGLKFQGSSLAAVRLRGENATGNLVQGCLFLLVPKFYFGMP